MFRLLKIAKQYICNYTTLEKNIESKNMPSYKYQYFDLRARGEIARLVFAEAGVEYEDFRIPFSDWATKYKPDTPFGQVPVLIVDGVKMCQSRSITRYLAKKFKLDGQNDLQSGLADMIIETVEEALFKLPLPSKVQGTYKQEVADKAFEENVYPVFDKIEKRLKENNYNYLVGKDVFTYADLHMLHACQTACIFNKDFLDRYPKLKDLTDRVAARPNVKKWLESRPDTIV